MRRDWDGLQDSDGSARAEAWIEEVMTMSMVLPATKPRGARRAQAPRLAPDGIAYRGLAFGLLLALPFWIVVLALVLMVR